MHPRAYVISQWRIFEAAALTDGRLPARAALPAAPLTIYRPLRCVKCEFLVPRHLTTRPMNPRY